MIKFNWFIQLSKPVKWALRILITCTVLFLLLLFFMADIAEYAIEKYSKKYTGRKIELIDLNLNLFTGNIETIGLTVFETDDKTPFAGCDTLNINLTLYKAFLSNYHITKFSVAAPFVHIIKKGNRFNFDDLIQLATDTSSSAPEKTDTTAIKYWIDYIKINKGYFSFTDVDYDTRFKGHEFNFSANPIAWDNANHFYTLSTALESGGSLKTEFSFNLTSLEYRLKLWVDTLQLDLVTPYLKTVLDVNAFKANTQGYMAVSGNFNTPDKFDANAYWEVNDFELTDTKNRKFTAFKKLEVQVDTVNTSKNYYTINYINLTQPFVLYEMFSKGTNIDGVMIVPNKSNETQTAITPNVAETGLFEMIANYIAELGKQFNESEFNIKQVTLNKGHIDYADFSLTEPFEFDFTDLNILSDKISSQNKQMAFKMNATLNHSGKFNAVSTISMQNYKDFMFNMDIEQLPMSSFNPFSKYYVAHPFWDGSIYFKSKNEVNNNVLKSHNALEIKKIEVGKKQKNKTALNVPVKFAVALLRDRQGNMKIEIPVEGNLADPNYKVGKAILKIVTNILVKAVTAPYDLLANAVSCNPDDLKAFKFEYSQPGLGTSAYKNLDLLAKVLTEKPGLKLELTQVINPEAEKNQVAIFELKKQYYFKITNQLLPQMLNADQIDSVLQIATSDSMFGIFVNITSGNHQTNTPLVSKCRAIYGQKNLDEYVLQALSARNQEVMKYLTQVKKINTTQFIQPIATKTENAFEDYGRFIINFAAK